MIQMMICARLHVLFETRASLKREKAKPLAVAPAVAPGTTTKEFAAAQFRDSSLAKLFERVNYTYVG